MLTRPYQVVANPPFGVTSALIRRLLQPGSRFLSAHLILEEQAVRRWAEGDAPGARQWERTFEISIGCTMPRSAFRPRPHVGCRVLVIKRRTGA